MNSRQRWENQGATLFSGKPCQIITSNSGLFFDLSGEVSHTETAWMLGESDRLPQFRKKCIIPDNVSLDFKDFALFATERKLMLAEQLKQVLR